MPRFKRLIVLAWGAMFLMVQGGPLPAQSAPQVGATVYLPLVSRNYGAFHRTVNAPYLNVPDVMATKFSEMAIFWYGVVDPTNNYTDVRMGYNDTALYVYTTAFDRLLWYDTSYGTSPKTNELTQWDAVTLYLNTTGLTSSAPTSTAYRFDAQVSWFESRANWQTAYRGNGTGWSAAAVTFNTTAGYDGSFNNNGYSKGWAMTFRIPFASLGLASKPADNTVWALAVQTHDRDDAGGTPIPVRFWPETLDTNAPATWGQLRFGGLPGYTPPSATGGSVVTVRQGLNGATVTDAQVGGDTVCGGAAAPEYFPTWGNLNYAGGQNGNIQNQSKISDWVCFSKYYLTFPLTSLPSSKAIISATLTLYQKGNSGPASNGDPPGPSLIQILTVEKDWSEATITWNNAPLAWENVSQAWVDPLTDTCDHLPPIAWPCIPRHWDVSRAVAQAYATNQPLRLVLYSADSAYSTGKYFTTSESGDWNAVGRPTLSVRWGNP